MSYEMKVYEGDEPRIDVTDEFISNNNLFGFGTSTAIDFLPLEGYRKFYKEEYLAKVDSGEEKHEHISDVKEAAQDFLDYMVFAWMKATDERGISASRSIRKLEVWMKILGRPDVAQVLDDDSFYDPYGRPALKEACKLLNITYPDYL